MPSGSMSVGSLSEPAKLRVSGRSLPKLDLEWLLSLEQRRKHHRRGSFLSADDVPRRSVIEQNKIIEYLKSQGFTIGLARTLIENTDNFAVRIWVIDNSSSMNYVDGHLVVQSSEPPFKIQTVDCTRWEEVSSTLLWHANFCALMEAPMVIRLVNQSPNGPQQLGVAASERVDIQGEVDRISQLMKHTNPEGNTPMTLHLRQIVDAIQSVPEQLLGQRAVSLVLVTDRMPRDIEGREGPPVNEEFVQSLKQLSGYSVWVVIRLSTDDDVVVDFYNALDNEMAYVSVVDDEAAAAGGDVHLDVLDDYVSEAEQVYTHNPWLNYAYPLHLCRESACNFPVFDVLNDRPLTHDELVEFVSLLFNRQMQAWNDQPLPNPKTQYRDFRKEVQDLVQRNPGLWNPIKKRIVPWVDLRQLDRLYGIGGSIINGDDELADAAATATQQSCCNIL